MSDSTPTYQTAEDVEFLIDQAANVTGVDVDPDGTVIALVTNKRPEEALDSSDIVGHIIEDQPTDVVEVGELRIEPYTSQTAEHRSRHRPTAGGVSEGPASRRSAGTAGPFVARVTDPDRERWGSFVKKGDYVRVSNNHVYAGSQRSAGNYGAAITQPAILDGGRLGDLVGNLAGYVPLTDGVTVDCAARTADPSVDSPKYLGIPNAGTAVRRVGFDQMAQKGEQLKKTGRTTGVSSANVIASSASVRVNMGDWVNVFRDQIVTGDMSKPGDSGSAVFDALGALVGLLFAGSDTATIVNKIVNVERELGVEFLPTPAQPGAPPHPNPSTPPLPGAPDNSPSEPVQPNPPVQTIRVSRPKAVAGQPLSIEFSIDFTGEVVTTGRSSTVVDKRINSWVAGWANTFKLRGHVTNASIPDHANVTLNGKPVTPADLPHASQAIASESHRRMVEDGR